MPDARISELPIASALSDTDLTPVVQAANGGSVTRRATIAQIRSAVSTGQTAHVRDYGAVGDGVTDDAPAIQAAINDLQNRGGGTLGFGPRSYRIASPIVVSGTMVRLQGAGFTEGPGAGQGTWLSIDGTGFTPFTFTGVAARGSAVRDIAVQQTHAAALNASWAPTNYPFVFRVEDCLGGIDFDNVFLVRVNRGIYCRNSGRLDIRRLRGQVFTTGVEIDECLDVPRIHNLHFWTFWTSDTHVVRWQQANGDALVFRRCDGVFVDQAFVLGYRSMFRFSASAAGNTTKFYIGQAYADFVKYGVWIQANGTDGQISNLTTQGEIFNAGGTPIAGSAGILVDASNTRLQVGNLRVDDAEDNAIRLNGSGNRLDIFSLRCVYYNTRNNGAAAIHLADSGASPPNAVHLGAPPLLEHGNGGPLVNAGTNATLAMQAPAGRAARPGLAVGGSDTGFHQPAAGALAASAGGVEVLRATGAGTVTLGAAPGGHAFEVVTPSAGANRVQVAGAASGSPVAVLAQGGDAHVGLVLGPRGNGALMAQLPDGAATGGHARGANAVDWQQVRANPTQVASGAQSFIGSGMNNTAAQNNAAVVAGVANQAGGIRAFVGAGQNNQATGTDSVVSGGNGNQASGLWGWVPGGSAASTRGQFGRGAWASGSFAAQGDAQAGEHVLRAQTSGTAPARLTADGAAPGGGNTANLPNGGTYLVRLMVLARQTGGSAGTVGDSAGWELGVLVRRGASASATSLLGGGSAIAPTLADAAAAGWRLSVSADTTHGGLAIAGTGEANKALSWVARLLSVEAVG
jgi:hypothetical protein